MWKFALPIGLLFVYYSIMPTVNKRTTKKGPGRPATGQDPVTAIRLSVDMRAALDDWRRGQPDLPSRSEAIRRLVEAALKASPRQRKAAKGNPRVPQPMVLKVPGIQED